MSVVIKICGLRCAEALDAAAEAGADWIGLVFFRPSPRFVDVETALALARRLPSRIGRAGLFVEPSDEQIAAVLDRVPLDALQIYASAPRAAEIRARFGLPVWRAVGVSAPADLPADAGGVERLVIEAKPPEGANRPGGNAARFDWRMLAGWTPPAPWVLAGGLDPDNVGEAIRLTAAPMVDVSSGVERERGVKDPGLIRAFIAAARG